MLSNLKKHKEEGFTIIEVMIVLVIAGAIILIVLLAIPALQRSQRNTTIKNDASAVASAIQEYQGANNGKLPTLTSGASLSDANGKVTVGTVTGKVKPGTDVTVNTTIGGTKDDTGKIVVVSQRKCLDDGTDVDTAVNKRSVALLYNIETSGNPVKNCLDA
jgi:prepilin-type N-terminal cleavage/methylation domain-containing protein